MEKSAGILIIQDNKILLGHPTRQTRQKVFSIPKGHVEDDESKIDAAIRETYEEVGLIVDKKYIEKEPILIEYNNKKGIIFKEVYCFIARVPDGTYPDDIPDDYLKPNSEGILEIDKASFFNKNDAKNIIFHRFEKLLDCI